MSYLHVKPERLAYLLDAGADLRAEKGYRRPFELALETGCYGSSAWRAYLDKFRKPSTQDNAIVIAIAHCLRMPEENFLPILDLLIARGYLRDRTLGMTTIEIAAQFGYARTVRVLLANGVSPDPPSPTRGSIFVSLTHCKMPAAIEIANLLLAKGASLAYRDWRGHSLVKIAREGQNQPLADFFLAHGVPE